MMLQQTLGAVKIIQRALKSAPTRSIFDARCTIRRRAKVPTARKIHPCSLSVPREPGCPGLDGAAHSYSPPRLWNPGRMSSFFFKAERDHTSKSLLTRARSRVR